MATTKQLLLAGVFLVVLVTKHGLCGSAEEWKARSVYQVLTDRFGGPVTDSCNLNDYCGGTFSGLIDHLDYIEGMGFDAIWISPVVTNTPGGYHGYWAKDFSTINSHFGSAADLKALVDAAHRRDMWVMLDIVLNHVGPVGSQFSAITPFSHPGDYHPQCSVSQYVCFTEEVLHCRLASLPDLNQQNATVADELVAWVGRMISEYQFDGIRADTVMYINQDFWARVQAEAGVYIVGEVYSSVECNIAYQKHGVDATLSYPMFFTLRSVFQDGQSMNLIQSQVDAYKGFPDASILGTFIDNHDNPRFLYQNTNKIPQYLNALTFVLFSQGVPIVYYGTEQYFAGGNDPANREILWPTKFQTSTPMYAFLAQLNSLRKNTTAWSFPQVQRYSTDNFYAFSRGSTLVALTNSGASFDISITYSPYTAGVKICNALAVPADSDCLVTGASGAFTVSMGKGLPKIYVPAAAESA
ncbi:uncharacterized protein AMSG_04296 [Thecamonas trahens ATCC 50062]|uniref:alpha-amylase n=1 Tax=Thecamonas trahens ATCC 50062 TaxID=461836 RepID=A0A0L0D7B1_THETB|nr:hypothetical protein AMSG_04296 [Thecamonas trahens ATCC 50062]KNC48065.1 hypothetical protein AMSG_04296 [Thecamonas trahens ATCC 50062]|eukprot:XP_013759080.1 hypothetical protein AMSG_04296 [Thecamonas trahens ATCC 50062]